MRPVALCEEIEGRENQGWNENAENIEIRTLIACSFALSEGFIKNRFAFSESQKLLICSLRELEECELAILTQIAQVIPYT